MGAGQALTPNVRFAGSGVFYPVSGHDIKRGRANITTLPLRKTFPQVIVLYTLQIFHYSRSPPTMEAPSNKSAGGKPSSADAIEKVDSIDKTNETGKVDDLDDALLQAQGHAAELDRSFSWMGAVGLAFRYVCALVKQ